LSTARRPAQLGDAVKNVRLDAHNERAHINDLGPPITATGILVPVPHPVA